MATARFQLILLLTAVHCCRSATVSLRETLNCTGNGVNSVLSQTSSQTPISSIFNTLAEYRTFSRIACAFICNNYKTGDCAAVTFDEDDKNCKLYSRRSQTSVTQILADPVLKYCWKNKIFNLLSLSSLSTTTATTTTSPATVASKTVTINGVSHASLSCHPQKLFPEASYIPKIPIAGKEADCKCEGGLSIQDGAYVNQSATTFADCFSACEKIASPPCKAFAFMEANNTCVIAPTNSNGDSNNKGVLQCYT